jgi:hypothetical protein
MISNLLLVVGVGVLSAALRSFQHPLVFRIGTLGIVATSFLAGWLLGGSITLGVVLAVSWLFLPWLEILTRVRKLRLPAERTLEPRTPPTRHTFPGFDDLTEEIEAQGFEYVEDIGWDHEENRHFYRIFSAPERKVQASICLAEQGDLAFYYLTVATHTADGRAFMTWNYPFSYGLKMQPQMVLQRLEGGPKQFAEMLEAHEKMLKTHGVKPEEMLDQTAEEIVGAMQKEMQAQIAHNISAGLLARDGEHFIRYTTRGMFYLWFQFLRDLVRFS